MSKVKLRAYSIGVILFVVGLLITMIPHHVLDAKTEEWMEKNAPLKIGNYSMLPGRENPMQTYKMDKKSYETLQPDGAVARVYENSEKTKRFEVFLITAHAHESFHDPRVCFGAHGWILDAFEKQTVPSKTRGEVPITLVRMHSSYEKDKLAAYMYKGPSGFYANLQKFKLSLLRNQLFNAQSIQGTFYRFIPNYPNAKDSELIEFMSEYLEAARKSSNDFF